MTELNQRQAEFAQALYQSYVTNVALNEDDWQGVVQDFETAYAVQERVMTLKGQPTAGYKVSLTSEETQKMFDTDAPLFGQQVAERFLKGPAGVNLDHLNEPLVEVELAFRAKETLQPTDSLEDFLHKTTVAGAVEVPDARFVDWFPSLGKYNVLSDCAVGGLVVYGEERDSDQAFSSVEDAATVHVDLYQNGQQVGEGDSSEVLGNPLKSLQWLVKKLDEQGKQFARGQVVSSGTFLLPPHLTAGRWEARFNHDFGNVLVLARPTLAEF